MVLEEVEEDFILPLTQLESLSCCKNQLFPPGFACALSIPRAQQPVPGCGMVFIWVRVPRELGRGYFCLPDNRLLSLLHARKTDEDGEQGLPG